MLVSSYDHATFQDTVRLHVTTMRVFSSIQRITNRCPHLKKRYASCHKRIVRNDSICEQQIRLMVLADRWFNFYSGRSPTIQQAVKPTYGPNRQQSKTNSRVHHRSPDPILKRIRSPRQNRKRNRSPCKIQKWSRMPGQSRDRSRSLCKSQNRSRKRSRKRSRSPCQSRSQKRSQSRGVGAYPNQSLKETRERG